MSPTPTAAGHRGNQSQVRRPLTEGPSGRTSNASTRTDRLDQQQPWDAATYHGLLAILKDPNASIAASCAAVEECLTINKDNLRGFFETCFAPLIGNVFGFDERYPGQGGWVNQVVCDLGGSSASSGSVASRTRSAAGASVTQSPSANTQAQKDVVALRKLFAPKGRLFMAMYNADCDGTIKYHFPVQRLPAISQMVLSSGHPLARLWPQYGGGQVDMLPVHGGPGSAGTLPSTHVHVSVLQYFCYWFAFYATKSLNVSGRDGSAGGMTTAMGTLGKRMLHPLSSRSQQQSSFSSFSSYSSYSPYSYGGTAKKASSSSSRQSKSMYLVLLRDLLQEFMPRPIDTREDEGLFDRAVTALNSNPLVSSYQDRPGTGMLMYSILIEFWLKDAWEPWLRDGTLKGKAGLRGDGGRKGTEMGSGMGQGYGSMTAERSWGASYDPPVENLLEAIEELTKYVMIYQTFEGNMPAQGGAGWLPGSPVLYAPADMLMSGAAEGGSGGGAGGSAGGSPAVGGHAGSRGNHLSTKMTTNSKTPVLHGPRSLGASASVGPQAYARQLYRMLHRALSSWPDQRSIKPLLKVFMVVLEPWRVASSAFSMSPKDGDGRAGKSSSTTAYLSDLVKSVGLDGRHGSSQSKSSASVVSEYTQEWEHHVLSHLPFYLDLVPMFLELSVSRVAARGEPSIQDVIKVLRVFERSEALVSLLQDVERDANRCFESEPRRADGTYAEILPWIIDQTENWKRYALNFGEDIGGVGGSHSGVYGAYSTRSRSHVSADGRSLTRAEPLFSMFSPDSAQMARNRHDIMSIAAGILKPSSLQMLQTSFDKVLPKYDDGSEEWEKSDPNANYDAYGPGWSRSGKTGPVRKIKMSTWGDAKFKGTELSKPKTSNEIAGLVNVMVYLSERINTLLTLDVPVARDEIPETVVGQWLFDLRRRGAMVNLRPLADVRNVVWLTVISFIVYYLVV